MLKGKQSIHVLFVIELQTLLHGTRQRHRCTRDLCLYRTFFASLNVHFEYSSASSGIDKVFEPSAETSYGAFAPPGVMTHYGNWLRTTFFTSSAGGKLSGRIPRLSNVCRTASLLVTCSRDISCSWLIVCSREL